MGADYVITLKRERKSAIDFVSILVILLSVFSFFSILSAGNASGYLAAAVSVLLLAFLIWNYRGKRNGQPVTFRWALLIAGITWLLMPFFPWIGFPILLLAALESYAKKPLVISFFGEHIVINNLLKKKLNWESFNNVMVKDGILTLDFKTNRIFQKEIVDENDQWLEEAFNAYCSRHLSSFKPASSA